MVALAAHTRWRQALGIREAVYQRVLLAEALSDMVSKKVFGKGDGWGGLERIKKKRGTYANPIFLRPLLPLAPLRLGPGPVTVMPPLARVPLLQLRPRHHGQVGVLVGVGIDMPPGLDVRLWHPLPVEVSINVIKPLAVRGRRAARRLNRLLAEAAPEARAEVAADAVVGELLVKDIVVEDAVVFPEVQGQRLAAVAHLAALELAVGGALGAPPDLELEVLAVFVALPVVLAAELFVAVGVGAVVGLRVALLVFPGVLVSVRCRSVVRS